MTLKSSPNIIRIQDKKESKKRKLNEFMTDNNINHLNGFQYERTFFDINDESPSKRSRNTVSENMSSNPNFNTNCDNKGSKSKNFFNTILSKIMDKFKSAKKDDKSTQQLQSFVRSDDNLVNRLSSASTSGDSIQVIGCRNSLNCTTNNANFMNKSQDLIGMNEKKSFNERVNDFDKTSHVKQNYKKTETNISRESNSYSKRNRKNLLSFRLQDRERYKLLLNSHISRSNSQFSSIASLNNNFNKYKKQEVIDLTSSVNSSRSSSLNRNDFLKSSDSRHLIDEGISKEKLDNRSKNNLVERIKNAGIIAQPLDTSSTPFQMKSPYNKSLFSTPNNSLRDSVMKTVVTQVPESSRKFNDLLKDNKQFLESNWIEDLRSSVNECDRKFKNDCKEGERKVLETKNKRQTDCENLRGFIQVPFTRSELSFVPFIQLEDKELDIYEEEDEEEEDSIAKDLPLLTQDMDKMIDDALRPTPPNQVLTEAFSLTITRKDMETLSGLNWLNDEIINFYMSLIVERSKNDNFSTSYAFNTFFYPKLIAGGHKALKRWTRRVDIFANDFIFIPVHLGMHWCLAVIDFIHKKIEYYDSMGGKNNECVQALKCYIQEESLDKKKVEYDMLDWRLEIVKDIPQQMNGSDCGMFTCKYAEYISRKAKINFSQAHMPYFRRRMVYEILTNKLL